MEKYVTANGKKIFCKFINAHFLQNNVPCIVFLHQGLGSTEQWLNLPADISKMLHLPVLLYDRYGYGKSQEITEKRNSDYLENEAKLFLPQILRELNIEKRKIILFGHSDGGTIAVLYAAFFPENTLAVITEAPHFFIEDISVRGISNVLHAYEKHNLKTKLEKFHGKNTDSMFYSWTEILLSEKMRKWNIEHYISRITCPVLAIHGEKDNFGTIKQIETIKQNSKGEVELLVITDCGHVPHQQAKKQIMVKVIDFLTKILHKPL